VIECLFYGVVDLLTKAQSPGTCLWVHGALSCGDDPLRPEFAAAARRWTGAPAQEVPTCEG